MPAYYLVPTESVVLIPNQPAVNAPKYVTEFGLPFSAIPMGIEGIVLLALAAPNASIGAEADVFTFGTGTLTDADVSLIEDYFTNANIPNNFAITGALWNDVLSQVAKIFLLAQALAGTTGQPIFAGTGVTLDSIVATQNQSQGKGKTGGTVQQTQNAVAAAAGSTAGPFDLSDVQDGDTISDTLTSVSQQFTAPILIGGGSL
jgi:hypothetical protein